MTNPTSIRQSSQKSSLWQSRFALVFGTVSCQFLIMGILTIQAIVVARALGPEARGQYATALFYTQTLLYAGLLGTLLSIARRAASPAIPIEQLQRSALRTGWWIGVVNLIVVGVLSCTALPADKQSLWLLCMACGLMLPIEHARLALLAVDHGREAFHRYNAQRLFAASVYPILVTALWLSGHATLQTVLAAAVVAPIVGLVAMRFGTGESLLIGPFQPAPRDLIREGIPYGAAQISAAVFERLDLILVLWFTSFRDQGLYAAAVPAASLMLIAPHALSLFAFNAGARHSGPLQLRKVMDAFAKLVAFQAVTAAAFAVVLGPIIRLVLGAEFNDAVPIALALLPAFALNGVARSAEAYLQGLHRATWGVWARVVGGGVMLVAAWFLIGRWHTVGVAMAASIGHGVTALWMLAGLIEECRETAGRSPARSFNTNAQAKEVA